MEKAVDMIIKQMCLFCKVVAQYVVISETNFQYTSSICNILSRYLSQGYQLMFMAQKYGKI